MPTHFDLDDLDLDANEEVRRLVAAVPGIQALRFDEGEILAEQGATDPHGFLVLRGAMVVEQSKGEGTPPSMLAQLDAAGDRPCFVGEMAHLGGGPRSASVRATFPTFALRIPPEGFDVITEELPGLTRVLCRQLSERLREANASLQEAAGLVALDCHQVQVDAGEVIVSAGQPATELFQLVLGAAQTEEGAPVEAVCEFLDPGSFLTGAAYPRTLLASEPCFLVAIAAQSREALLRRHPELALALLAELEPV